MLPARKPSIRAAAFFDISGPDMVTGGDEHVLEVVGVSPHALTTTVVGDQYR
jgi:hypothetical protein